MSRPSIYVNETWIDRTANCGAGESDWYDTGRTEDQRGELFQALRREYGRCVSKMYVELPPELGGKTCPIGWVFEKRRRYDDTDEVYVLETWVETSLRA